MFKHEFYGTIQNCKIVVETKNVENYISDSEYRLITKICDWAKYDNRLQFKKYMSDQAFILPK